MRRASLLVLLLASCGSPPPGSVDHESLLVDLSACIRNDVSCQKSGSVTAVSTLMDEKDAIRLTTGGSISLPINRENGRKLAWIAIGVSSRDVDRRLAVTVSGQEGTIAQPTWGFARVEIAQGDIVPAADARLHLVAEAGTFEVLWVVGRWKD